MSVRKWSARWWWVRGRPWWIASVAIFVSFGVAFLVLQERYGKIVEADLRQGAFKDTASIYVTAKTFAAGVPGSIDAAVADLRLGGFTESPANLGGWFEKKGNELVIHATPPAESAVLKFAGNKLVEIRALHDKSTRDHYQLEPRVVTNVSLRNRERRRLLRFEEIPKILIDAVVSVEDKRFFQHQGFDLFRIVKAAYVNLEEGRAAEGASTITMQLVRSLWLLPDKSWKRKQTQFFMALRLERTLSKQQIFEHYSNEVYLGHRGTYEVHGFGEAAHVFFNKTVGALTLSEAATLAGVIQRPSYYNPYQFPARVRERRDQVLALMQRNGHITRSQFASASAELITLSPSTGESVDAPYYVDLLKAELQGQPLTMRGARDGFQVYSTIDPRLQRAAIEAVRNGMAGVDKLVRKVGGDSTMPQVALVALDPRTGAIKALVGGRDYDSSQLNHALAKRQPGSVFKPFVYAAALRATEQGAGAFSPVTIFDDAPTTFWYGNEAYQPSNFGHQFNGDVTLRQALTRSLNIVTIKLAEKVGYRSVVELARAAGLSQDIKATPSVALGAYESTPLEIAGAYTVFANEGVYVRPHLVDHVLGDSGERIYSHQPVTRRALSPQVAYMMVSLLEGVLHYGTGAGVRARGFTAPAAGKTGTSRDGWFAGFTSDLLCVVWVGFDDHRDLKLEGSKSALPIWADFMKQAVALNGAPKPFKPAAGIRSAQIDADSGLLATPECPKVRYEVFLPGTEPSAFCDHHATPAGQPTSTASAAIAN